MNDTSFKSTLSMAINNEIEAYEFYKYAANKSKDANLKTIFAELAEEELKHQHLLESFLKNGIEKMHFQDSVDYKISETIELPKLTTDMSYVDGIALAMKKEEEAMKMYTKFAEASIDADLKNTFLQLAKMEKGHKLKLETLYNNSAYNENF